MSRVVSFLPYVEGREEKGKGAAWNLMKTKRRSIRKGTKRWEMGKDGRSTGE